MGAVHVQSQPAAPARGNRRIADDAAVGQAGPGRADQRGGGLSTLDQGREGRDDRRLRALSRGRAAGRIFETGARVSGLIFGGESTFSENEGTQRDLPGGRTKTCPKGRKDEVLRRQPSWGVNGFCVDEM